MEQHGGTPLCLIPLSAFLLFWLHHWWSEFDNNNLLPNLNCEQYILDFKFGVDLVHRIIIPNPFEVIWCALIF